MKPTSAQQRVIESTARDILVEAGAGSGKTSTTVSRYVHLLERGYEPREILAFTFTDKAAGELRERVRAARRNLAQAQGETNPQALSMSAAWIGTFHAICNRILRAWPVEAGVDPGFTVIDDVTSETLRMQAFGDALNRFCDGTDRSRREAMVAAFTVPVLRRTTLAVYDELRSRGHVAPTLPDFEDTPYPEEEISYLRRNIDAILDLKGHAATHRPKLADLELLLADPDVLPRCADLEPLRFNSRKESMIEFCETLHRAVAALGAHEEGDFARRGIGRLLELFGERFTELKSHRSVLDYEDLQLKTLELLRRNERIGDAYRSRFREIMVDEFQDTNQLQLDLIDQLRGPDATLLTVGDEMQSIYGFRHAEVELFRRRRDDPGVATYRLSDNFRSQPEVIAAVNEIGLALERQVEAKRGSEVGDRHRFSELTVGRDDRETASSVTAILTGREGWKPLDLGELAPAIPPEAEVGKDEDHFHEAEALRVAHHLRHMVDTGVARQGEIAILLRAKTRTDFYVNALKQVGLTPYLSAGRGFWKSREAIEIQSLLSVIANPLEDEALLGALASPACGASSDALWMMRQTAPSHSPLWPVVRAVAGDLPPQGSDADWLEKIPETDRERITKFVETLDRLRALSTRVPLDTLVEEAAGATGYDLANLIRDRSRNGFANVRRVASLAHDYELAEGRDLRGFLDWIALSAELDSESAAAVQEEDSDVIRIMTVHAAKGLEFKVAVVPDCGRRNSDNHTLPIRLGKPDTGADRSRFKVGLRLQRVGGGNLDLYDWDELKHEAALANEDEELRLFHVALTRAKDHLVVSGVLGAGRPKEISDSLPMISRFGEGFDLDPEDPEEWPETVPEGADPDARIVVVANLASEETARYLRGTAAAVEDVRPVRMDAPPIDRPVNRVFPNVPLSFTAISEFEECPTRFYAKRVLGLEEPGTSAAAPQAGPAGETVIKRDHGTRFGSAVHDVLEALGNYRWPTVQDEMLRTALTRRGLDPSANLEPAREMVEGFTRSDLGVRVREGSASFEVPLLFRTGSITVRGFADVLLDGEVPLVLDYKTNDLGGRAPIEKMEVYRQQRNLYALAVARSRGLEAVETAFVFLARPDEPVVELLDRDALATASAELDSALERIAAGRFFGGPEADRQPCRECWACSALAARIDRAGTVDLLAV